MGKNSHKARGAGEQLPGGASQAHAPQAEAPAGQASEQAVMLTKAEFETLKARADERDALNDKYLRAHAEFENARRRNERDKMDYARYANEGMIVEFLPVIDSLEMSEKYIKEAKDFKAVRDGIDMIHGQIQKFLKSIGMERVKTVGEKFDPNVHEAMSVVEDMQKEDGLIIEELKSGYRYNEKLLRPAMVKIVKNEHHGGAGEDPVAKGQGV